jgi:hypothetical protein
MAEMHNAAAPHPEGRHEGTDVNIVGIFGFGAALLIVGILVHFMVWLLFQYFAGREAQRVRPQYPLAVQQQERLPPQPRLQINPREDMRNLRASEDAILDSYGWVDKNTGIVRIPIDKAMELAVQRGLPARPEARQGNK